MPKLDIPENWVTTTLGVACAKITDGTHHSPKNTGNGDFKYISAKHIKNWGLDVSEVTYVSKKVHDEIYARCDPKYGDVLLIKDGATTGVAAINTLQEQFSMLSSVALLRPSSVVLNYFLLFFLKSPKFQERVLGDMAGAAIKRVTLSKLTNIPLPVPPLGEQKRIVARIESTKAKVAVIESCVTQAEELIAKYRDALLQKAFRGELVPQNPNDEPASDLLKRIRAERAKQTVGKKRKQDDLPPIKPEEIPFEIPKSWEWVRLGDLATFVSGYAFKSSDIVEKDTGLQLIRIGNITTNGLDLAKSPAYLPKIFSREHSDFLLKQGDLLISLTGTVGKEDFGNAVLVDTDVDLMLNQRVLAIRSDHSHFLAQFFRTRTFLNQFFAIAKGQRQANVSTVEIKSLLVPLPPKSEQQRIDVIISEHLSKVGSVAERVTKIGSSVSILSSSILNHAFSGRLVSQIASEGTGHELLASLGAQLQSEDGLTKMDKGKRVPLSKVKK